MERGKGEINKFVKLHVKETTKPSKHIPILLIVGTLIVYLTFLFFLNTDNLQYKSKFELNFHRRLKVLIRLKFQLENTELSQKSKIRNSLEAYHIHLYVYFHLN